MSQALGGQLKSSRKHACCFNWHTAAQAKAGMAHKPAETQPGSRDAHKPRHSALTSEILTEPPPANCSWMPASGKSEGGGKPPLRDTMPGMPANWPDSDLWGGARGRGRHKSRVGQLAGRRRQNGRRRRQSEG